MASPQINDLSSMIALAVGVFLAGVMFALTFIGGEPSMDPRDSYCWGAVDSALAIGFVEQKTQSDTLEELCLNLVKSGEPLTGSPFYRGPDGLGHG